MHELQNKKKQQDEPKENNQIPANPHPDAAAVRKRPGSLLLPSRPGAFIIKMPNANYVKGRNKEYRIVNTAKAQGKLAFRSAGSHSPVDVVIIDSVNRKIELVQCKPDNYEGTARILKDYAFLSGQYTITFIVR